MSSKQQQYLLDATVRGKMFPLLTSTMAIPSFFGSMYIIQHVMRSEKRRSRVFTRIMLGMSVIDMITSLVDGFSQLPVPADLAASSPSSYWMARGNWTTCEIQGFLGQARTVSVLYNGSLQLYYYLTIRCGWKERQLRNKKWVEWGVLHAVPWIVGWSLAVVSLPLQTFNPSTIGCRVTDYPYRCSTNPDVECLRGQHGSKISLLTRDLPVWTVAIFNSLAMIMIYHQLHRLDKKNDAYRFEMTTSTTTTTHQSQQKQQQQQQHQSTRLSGAVPSSTTSEASDFNATSETGGASSGTAGRTSSSRGFVGGGASSRGFSGLFKRNSSTVAGSNSNNMVVLKRRFATQAMLYFLAFLLTWAFTTYNVHRTKTGKPPVMPLIYVNIAFLPLQGFWNALIYIRPRYLRYRREQNQQQQQALHERQRKIEEAKQQQLVGGGGSGKNNDEENDGQKKPSQQQRNSLKRSSRLMALIRAVSVHGEDDEDDFDHDHTEGTEPSTVSNIGV